MKTTSFVAIPYCTWDNRKPGPMVVWLPERPELAEPPGDLGVLSHGVRVKASHVWQNDTLTAVNDGAAPKSSNDQNIHRHTWWHGVANTRGLMLSSRSGSTDGLFCSRQCCPKFRVSANISDGSATARHFLSHLRRRLVRSEPNIDRLSQELVGGPGEIGDLGDEPRLDPMDLRKNERRAKAGLARRRRAQR